MSLKKHYFKFVDWVEENLAKSIIGFVIFSTIIIFLLYFIHNKKELNKYKEFYNEQKIIIEIKDNNKVIKKEIRLSDGFSIKIKKL